MCISTPSGGPFQARRKGGLGDVGFCRAGGLLPFYEYSYLKYAYSHQCLCLCGTRLSALILNDRLVGSRKPVVRSRQWVDNATFFLYRLHGCGMFVAEAT